MPCRISNDVHERINKLVTVPTFNSVKLRGRERSVMNLWGEKTLWSFTAAWPWDISADAERRWERRNLGCGRGGCTSVTPPFIFCVSNQKWNSCRWIVWLGRYALDKETRAPNAILKRVRNPLVRVKDKWMAD